MIHSDTKNIIFDIGNVLVKWSPLDILRKTFPECDNTKIECYLTEIFKSRIWTDLNLGILTEEEAKNMFVDTTCLSKNECDRLFHYIKATQIPVPGMHELLKLLHCNDIPLFALSDNVKEIIAYLRKKYTFLNYFKNITISSNVGMMKPEPNIFMHVLEKNNLTPNNTIFIDDHLPNVEAAKTLSILSFQFIDYEDCYQQLRNYGVTV